MSTKSPNGERGRRHPPVPLRARDIGACDFPRRRTAADLPTPLFPHALDGGLGSNELESDPNALIPAQIPPWDGYENGDTLSILWGAAKVEVGRVFPSFADRFQPMTVFVPAGVIANIGDGLYPVYARVKSILGAEVESFPATVRVKLPVPGGHDPDPTTGANENLIPPTVSPTQIGPGQTARVTVPPYDNMDVGDVVTVQWNSSVNRISHPPLTAPEIGQPVIFDITSDMIDKGGAGERVAVHYQVYDIVQNWSGWSPASLVEVTDPNAPPAPNVDPTVGGTVIDLVTLGSADIRVYVQSSGVRTGESVVVHWSGTTAWGAAITHDTSPQTATRDDEALLFMVPNSFVTPLGQGSARASYTIQPPAGFARQSAKRNLQVLGPVWKPLPPTVQESVNNTLDPADVPTFGAHAVVPPWGGMQAGDQLELVLEGLTANASPTYWSDRLPISGGMVNLPVDFRIPRSEIDKLLNGSLTLYYVIRLFGTTSEAGTMRVAVLAPLRSDPLNLLIRSAAPQPQLKEPIIREAVNGVLDPDRFPTPHVDVPLDPRILTGDRIELALRGGIVPYDDFTVVSNPSVLPGFVVPANVISANRNQTLTATYTVIRTGVTYPSLVASFRIGAAAADLPQPVVDQAVGGTLDPFAVANGMTVRIPATVSLSPNDRVIVTITGSGGTGSTAPQTGNANGMMFSVDPGVIARNLGRAVDIHYTATPLAGGAPRPSPVLPLNVLDLPTGDTRVARPVIVEANGSYILQLGNFTGDATVEVRQWPLMASGQRYWLRASSGASETVLANGQMVNAPGNPRHTLSRAWLTPLANRGSVELELKVAFDGGSEQTAKVFRSAAYTVLGSAWTVDFDFDSEAIRSISPGQVIRFPQFADSLMNIEFDRETPVPADDRIGVERYPFQESGHFKGRNLFIGAPEGANHPRHVFINFAESWDIVSFVVTSAHERVTISFKDSALNVLLPIKELLPSGPTYQHVVEYNDGGRGRIRHVEIRTTDVIRLDAFKFRRASGRRGPPRFRR